MQVFVLMITESGLDENYEFDTRTSVLGVFKSLEGIEKYIEKDPTYNWEFVLNPGEYPRWTADASLRPLGRVPGLTHASVFTWTHAHEIQS